MEFKKLSPEEERVIIHKGTERPFTGKYNDFNQPGTYLCKRCRNPLYKSTHKFASNCGWPSFDDQIPNAVKHQPDVDGRRTEILCANCGAHLGHVFTGEGYTEKNTRHCVNSISMDFVPEEQNSTPDQKTETAYFAGGCFWGVEYWLKQQKGVRQVTSGFMGGKIENPTYRQVCSSDTGHAETVRVDFDPEQVSFKQLAKVFFEIHDPTQLNQQGPDVGTQYRSVIFYNSESQKAAALELIGQLRDNGHDVKTELVSAGKFWPAEQYHQEYYEKTGKTPYCHQPVKRFKD